ncbi:MAG TPA: HAMP domain-containing sensor histidine kinase [Acidimicrobiales bacterium]|nr:HAMP domain-containing sensor histidine kinase [Acidimicrobiales bacterium]
MSLRRRLLAGLVGVAAVLIVTNVVLSSTIQRFLLDRLDRQLVDVASRPVFRGDGRRPGGGPGGGGGHDWLSNDEPTLSEYFIAVGDPNADALTPLSSAFFDESEAPRLRRSQLLSNLTSQDAAPHPFTTGALEGRARWRLVAVEDPRFGATVVGISLEDVDKTIERIRLVQVFGTLAVLAALGLVSWWMLRLGVHPIEDMARTADAIAAGDLSQRVEHPGERTEAGRLGVALNSMLGRIEEAFHAREASEERVRRFAADASHELRTPLTSIQGYAELWRAGGLRDDGELGEAMRRMEQEATRMGALVEDLLALARLDQRRPMEMGQVRLHDITGDAVRDARAVEPDRPIELVVTPVTVRGDEMRLRQVVANLLANVRAHTPAGTPVRVTVGTDGVQARIDVADQGPGLEPEVAAKVFERFFRADKSRARARGGSGLGLSIVAAIAEAHGGRAVVSSVVGKGSTFSVLLPVAASPPEAGPPLPDGAAVPAAPPQEDPVHH